MIGSTAAIALLVTSIMAVGVAQSSYAQQQQQQQLTIARGFITSAMIVDNTIVSADLRDGAAVRSEDIVDGQVNTADLADNAVTSDKVRDGEVKAEDLDPAIQIGGETPSFGLQVTERNNSFTGTYTPEDPQPNPPPVLSVQCNSDEVVTGGGFSTNDQNNNVLESKKQDNGWTVTWTRIEGITITVYAECLKIVNEEGTPG